MARGRPRIHPSVEDLQAENEQLRELLCWIAPRIEVRTASMQKATQFCFLCSSYLRKIRRAECKHDAIWRIAAEAAQGDDDDGRSDNFDAA